MIRIQLGARARLNGSPRNTVAPSAVGRCERAPGRDVDHQEEDGDHERADHAGEHPPPVVGEDLTQRARAPHVGAVARFGPRVSASVLMAAPRARTPRRRTRDGRTCIDRSAAGPRRRSRTRPSRSRRTRRDSRSDNPDVGSGRSCSLRARFDLARHSGSAGHRLSPFEGSSCVPARRGVRAHLRANSFVASTGFRERRA